MTITFELKDWFFDRQQVLDAVGKATARVLAEQGALVRRTARGKIRFQVGPSEPGESPHAHSRGTASLRTIWFALEPDKATVIVGPIRLTRSGDDDLAEIAPAPNVLEFGGLVIVRQVRLADGTWHRQRTRHFTGRRRITRIVQTPVEPRPFMRPSLDQEAAGNLMISQWKDAIHA